MAPIDRRLDRLDRFLAAEDLEAVWFARPNTFAWLTGGSNVVSRGGDTGVAAVGYDGERLEVRTDNIEAERLRKEELPAEVTVEQYDWYERSLADAVASASPEPAAADFDVPGFESVAGGQFRQPLLEADIDEYRTLGEATTTVLESVLRSASPQDTERAVAAEIRGRLATHGIDTPVALVGSSERAPAYRHFTPTETPLGEYAVASVTAQRDGLFASCSRIIAFDPPAWLDSRHRVAARVEATALAATRAAGTAGEAARTVFDAIVNAYEQEGWQGEWRNHHQGGASGFAGREWFATPESDAAVQLPMGYAWNPTVQGAKSEDTVLVRESGYELLTGGDWPTITTEAVGYDETFERPAVLVR